MKPFQAGAVLLALLLLAIACSPVRQSPDPSWTNNPARVLSDEEVAEEIAAKMERVQTFLEERRLRGLLLTTYRNYSWITAGVGNNRIEFDKEGGAVSLLILNDGSRHVLANGSEAARVMEERLGDLGYELARYNWYEANPIVDLRDELLRSLAGEGTVASDAPWPGAVEMAAEIAPLRYRLTPTEVKKYRWLGRESAEAVEEVCRRLRPGMTEYEIEAMTARELWSRGIVPTVLLIGSDERLHRYRHALPTEKELERYGMVNVCTEKWGLVVAVTRFVHFGPLPQDLETRLGAAARVHARYQHATRPGVELAAIFERMQEWYAEEGYPGEWKLHHQGGAIGYNNREFTIYPGIPRKVMPKQAFAWNPTVTGAKVEDTILAREGGIEVLTRTDDWPLLEVEVEGTLYPQPDILVLD